MNGGTGVRRCGQAVRRGLRAPRPWITRVELGPRTAGTPGRREDRPGAVRARCVAKRAFDIAAASVLLVVALPVLVAIAGAVKVESPGPVFYRAWRTGYRNEPVGVLKFRKMRHDAVGQALTARHDQRLTGVGAVLVRTHLDELPQLWNVLVGQMSLVGPRPEDPRFTELHSGAYQDIVSVRPGLTGCTQLVWVDESQLLPAARDPIQWYVDDVLPWKVALDLAYATRPRLGTDARILLWTPFVLLLGLAVVVDRERHELRLVRRGTGHHDAPRVPEPSAGLVEEAAG
jgi:lipopolysaccharide/colanic/teichoic acid biosynthesis glycosyltransferase